MRSLPFTITILLALFVSIGTAQPLSGQAPARDGFFIGFGVGGGSIVFEGDSEREVGGGPISRSVERSAIRSSLGRRVRGGQKRWEKKE
jgi:hypothetical protein